MRVCVFALPLCTICVFILCLHKYACMHVFGQDKKRAEGMKGKLVTRGRETDKEKGGGRERGKAKEREMTHLLC